jgi:hypothetical protein
MAFVIFIGFRRHIGFSDQHVVGIKIGQIKVMLLWLSKNYAQNENSISDGSLMAKYVSK